MEIDLEKVRELIELLKSSQISELSVRNGDTKITVKKELGLAALAGVSGSTDGVPASAGPDDPELEGDQHRFIAVPSPVVGRLRLSRDAGEGPLTAVGQHVKGNDTLCLVESLGHLHEVLSPESGKVTRILGGEDQAVEFGENLMVIERDSNESSPVTE